MAENVKTPGIDAANQANIKAILEAYKARVKEMNAARAKIGSSAGSIAGAAIVGALSLGIGVPAGAAIGSAVGGVIGSLASIFNKKQPWSGLSDEDKQNLIKGLTTEAVWVKGIFDVQTVKNYVINVLQTSNPQIVENNNTTFYGKNAWAVNVIALEIDKAKKLVDQINRIQKSFDNAVVVFEQKQNLALGFQAYLKSKAGQSITQTEANALVWAQAHVRAINVAKRLKIGLNPQRAK